MSVISLLCADLAGTTVDDGGAVLESFAVAVDDIGLRGGDRDRALAYAAASMGQSKIEVFRAILGDEAGAEQANAAFERSYAGIVERGGIAAMPGAADVFAWCRQHGIRVCLTTGFAPPTRDAIIERLGWGSAADLALSPADAGRGRPAPDMVLTALIRLGIDDVRNLAVVGDTVNDLLSGHRAGASIVAAVLTGAHAREQLSTAPHTHLLASIADLPAILR